MAKSGSVVPLMAITSGDASACRSSRERGARAAGQRPVPPLLATTRARRPRFEPTMRRKWPSSAKSGDALAVAVLTGNGNSKNDSYWSSTCWRQPMRSPLKVRPSRYPETARASRTSAASFGSECGLLVRDHLHAVLGAPQESVGGNEAFGRFGGDMSAAVSARSESQVGIFRSRRFLPPQINW